MIGTIKFVDKNINDNGVRELDHCDVTASSSELLCGAQQSWTPKLLLIRHTCHSPNWTDNITYDMYQTGNSSEVNSFRTSDECMHQQIRLPLVHSQLKHRKQISVKFESNDKNCQWTNIFKISFTDFLSANYSRPQCVNFSGAEPEMLREN